MQGWSECTRVDLGTSLWSYNNCKMVTDFPAVVVMTPALNEPSFMYSALKLTPALYDFDIRSKPNMQCTCNIEILEVDTNGNTTTRIRSANANGIQQTLRWLVIADTNAELRLNFNSTCTMRTVSFDHVVVRSRKRLSLPFKRNILTGVQMPVRLSYRLVDLHRVLKMIHYALNWLKTTDTLINEILATISTPLWDFEDSQHEYAHMAQTLNDHITENLPQTLFATNSYYRIQIDPQLRLPLISRTLVTKLSECIMAHEFEAHKTDIVASLHHSLHYINFMLIEYIDFKNRLQNKISRNSDDLDEVCSIDTIHLPSTAATNALRPATAHE